MLEKTDALVLHYMKYGDSSIIAHFYTREFGRKSFIISGLYNKKNSIGPALFQVFNMLNLVVYYKHDRDLNRIKELKSIYISDAIHTDPYKIAISLFISEILYKTLKEEVPNQELFEFLTNAIQILDLAKEGISNFHLLFLIEYSRFLGFNPTNNYSNDLNKYFSLIDGKFCDSDNNVCCNIELSNLIAQFLNLKISEGYKLKINNQQRNMLLKVLIDYYLIHIDSVGEIHSMAVLEEVFRN